MKNSLNLNWNKVFGLGFFLEIQNVLNYTSSYIAKFLVVKIVIGPIVINLNLRVSKWKLDSYE